MIDGSDLSVIAIIGIILLIGIVKKNAIMMVDFALDAERNEGKSPREAIYQACLLRFRPILMTTMAALFAALPLMLGTGTGSELRHPLGGDHRRRSDFQPVADPVYDTGHLSRLRPPRRRVAPPVQWRRGRSRRAAAGEPVGAVHQAAGRDHAADPRHRARRIFRLSEAAGGAAAAGRFPDDLGVCDDAGGEPGHDGDDRGDAARTPSRHHCRRHRNDLAEHGRHDPDHAAIRSQPEYRRRRARCSGGDQRGARGSADQPAHTTRPTAKSTRPMRRSRSWR